jgi:elongation factor G
VKRSVKITLELIPNERGKGIEFIPLLGEGFPQEVLNVIREGVMEATTIGVLGYPLTDLKVLVKEVEFGQEDFFPLILKAAVSQAIQEASNKASPILLEPIMELTVVIPTEFMGEVIGDIQARKGTHRGDKDQRPDDHPQGRSAFDPVIRLLHRFAFPYSRPRELFHEVLKIRCSPRMTG